MYVCWGVLLRTKSVLLRQMASTTSYLSARGDGCTVARRENTIDTMTEVAAIHCYCLQMYQ